MDESSYPDALPAQYRLHWYTLERVLGQGGFGITYLARDTNLDQAVAIKEYLPVDVATRRADATVRPRTGEQTERYRWGLERFIREARTLARFDHPNIVRVHSVFEFNNTAYMVMRFEEGENLAALLERRRTLPEAELMRVVLPIVEGLQLVHNAGFIHRDIKPDNVHIRADGSPVLLDFGSARLALGHARTVTILVAPGYAPFEQYYGAGENQGPWTDVYGLGATCYRAISGIVPMDAIARSKGILGSTREVLVPATAIGSGRYSERLLKAIDHALEFSEKDRPQTLAEWRRELVDAPAALPAAAPTAPPAPAVPSAPAAARREEIPVTVPLAPQPDRWAGVRGPVIGAAVGAIVAVGAVVFWLQPANNQEQLREELKRSEAERKRLEEDARAKEAKLQQERARLQREDEEKKKIEAKQLEEQRRLAAETRQREEQKVRDAEQKRLAEAARAARTKPPTAVAPRPAKEPPAQPMLTATAPQPTPPTSPAKLELVPAPAKPAASEPPAAKPPVQEPTPVAAARPAEKAAPDDRTRALQGDPAAQFKLGEMYENGRGVTQNNNQAYIWYSAAARGGYALAKAKKEQMAARLQPAEIHQADRVVEGIARPPQ